MFKAIITWLRLPSASWRIRSALSHTQWRSATEIGEIAKVNIGWRYPELLKLEHHGIAQSKWEDGPPPRRRLYRLAAGGNGK